MSRSRKNMKEIRNIFTVKLLNPQASMRFIAQATHCSRPVVKEYLDRLNTVPLTLEELKAMTDPQLALHLQIEPREIQETDENRVMNSWLAVNAKRLSEKLMTRRLLHELYLEEHPDGLHYSQFCFVLRQQTKAPEASGMFDHKAGDKLYLDFTGSKLHWHNELEQSFEEDIFLAVLGASSYQFSLPVPSQKQEDFVHATQSAFLHLGGVPCAVVPDCLKSAVISHDGYESVPNKLFAMLLSHYGVVSIPARPYHPKDKPSVETAVKMLYTNILAKLDNNVFSDRIAMLRAWIVEMNKLNHKPFQKLPGSRYERFVAVDKPALKPLPATEFSLTTVLSQTVQPTLTVYVPEDKTAYSVPYSLQGKKVEVLIGPREIEVWHDHQRHASHSRQPNAGKVIVTEHLAIAQRWYATRNTAELLRELMLKGLHVGKWAQEVVDTAEHEDLAWRVLDGLKSLCKKQPDRIDRVCRIALREKEMRLKNLHCILSKEQDIVEAETEFANGELPFHENVRGSGYYNQEGPQ